MYACTSASDVLKNFQIPNDLKMAKAAMPLVASANVCPLLLFFAVTVSLACNPTDIYWPPQTKIATTATTTTSATAMTWSRMMASEEVSRS